MEYHRIEVSPYIITKKWQLIFFYLLVLPKKKKEKRKKKGTKTKGKFITQK